MSCYNQETFYECGIAAYHLVKLQLSEFYYHFFDKHLNRKDFFFCCMDTDSFYVAINDDTLDEIIQPEWRQVYEVDNKTFACNSQRGSIICVHSDERARNVHAMRFLRTRNYVHVNQSKHH